MLNSRIILLYSRFRKFCFRWKKACSKGTRLKTHQLVVRYRWHCVEWQGQNSRWFSLAFIIDWRVVSLCQFWCCASKRTCCISRRRMTARTNCSAQNAWGFSPSTPTRAIALPWPSHIFSICRLTSPRRPNAKSVFWSSTPKWWSAATLTKTTCHTRTLTFLKAAN